MNDRPPFERTPIDPNTNFRRFYLKDNSFYLKVLE